MKRLLPWPTESPALCRLTRALAISLGCILLASCRSFLDPAPLTQPDGVIPDGFTTAGTKTAEIGEWWEAFGVAELNSLVSAALADNLDLQQAYARLLQARALYRQAGSLREPALDAQGGAGTTRTRRAGQEGYDRDSFNDFSLGLVASYEVDLWGRIRAGVRSSELGVEAARYDLQAAAMSIAAETVTSWLQHVAGAAELRIVIRQLETNRDYLELLKVRQRTSLANALDVFQQQQIVAGTETLIPPVEREIELANHRLNVLLGKPPRETVHYGAERLPDLPSLPDIGIPASLLANRPDLRAGWLRLAAAGWEVTAAKADRLPALRLTGAASYDAGQLDELFDGWIQNLAASLAAPLLDGGRRKAEVARAQAMLEEQLSAYRESVLNAIVEVEDALARERHDVRRLEALKRQLDNAEKTLLEAGTRYRNGLNDYLPVLAALEVVQRLERTILQAEYSLLANRVALYRAVGGSWSQDVLVKFEEDRPRPSTAGAVKAEAE